MTTTNRDLPLKKSKLVIPIPPTQASKLTPQSYERQRVDDLVNLMWNDDNTVLTFTTTAALTEMNDDQYEP